MDNQPKTIPLSDIRGSIDLSGIIGDKPCPFLASDYDGMTPMAFPHPRNHCYRHGDALERQPQFQRTYCLSSAYETCPIYQQKEKPQNQSIKKHAPPLGNNWFHRSVPIIIMLIIFAALVSLPALAMSPIHNQAVNLPLTADQIRGFFAESAPDSPQFTPPGYEPSLSIPAVTAPETITGQPGDQAGGNFRAITYPQK